MKKIPKRILLTAAGALIFGLVTVSLSKFIHHSEDKYPWNEVLRDIGISFIVAGFISVVYEWSTRSLEKKDHMKHVLDETLSVFIPTALWQEVQSDVFLRRVFRTNMIMDIVLYDTTYLDNETNTELKIPKDILVLYSKMSYQLKSISTGISKIDIKHHLDQHMYNTDINLPKFIKAKVIDTDENEKIYTGQTLGEVVTEGILNLSNENAVKVSYEGNISQIEIERIELANCPGLYTIVLPEMVIPDASLQKSISVNIDSSKIKGNNLKLAVQTWFNSPKHNFTEQELGTQWTFNGVMLPGQGFSIQIAKS